MDCSPPAPLSMEFSRQEYWSGDLPHPEIKPRSPALQADSLPFEPLGRLVYAYMLNKWVFPAVVRMTASPRSDWPSKATGR